MHKWLLNECRLSLTLHVPGRLQVAAPREDKDTSEKAGNLTEVVREGGRLYLPGSSLKGVLRQRAEYIANLVNEAGLGACHLFDPALEKPAADDDAYRRLACGYRFNIRQQAQEAGRHTLAMSQRYRDACPACQLFGHTFHAGHLRLTDFMVVGSGGTRQVPHTALDRITNSVASRSKDKGDRGSGQLFTHEYVTNSSFSGELVINNFSLWQLGWLGYLLRDLQDGLIRVGHKRTSGAGQVAIQAVAVRLRQIPTPTTNVVHGVSEYLRPEQQTAYGCPPETAVSLGKLAWQRDGLWHVADLAEDAQKRLWQKTYPLASDYLRRFTYGQEMAVAYLSDLLAGGAKEVAHA